jgi:hypothetical protein
MEHLWRDPAVITGYLREREKLGLLNNASSIKNVKLALD